MDAAQIILIVVACILLGIAVFLSIQLYGILKEIKGSVIRVNRILDDAGKVSSGIAAPVGELSGVISGIKAGLSLLSMIQEKKISKTKKEDRLDE
jgi:hypothetical protein